MHCWIGPAGRNFFVDGREASTGDPQSSRAELDHDTGVKPVFLIYEIRYGRFPMVKRRSIENRKREQRN